MFALIGCLNIRRPNYARVGQIVRGIVIVTYIIIATRLGNGIQWNIGLIFALHLTLSEFKHQLAALEPFTLYSGVLRDLWRKYASSKVMQRTSPELYRILVHDVAWQSQHCGWQEWKPSLESLFTLDEPRTMPTFLN